LVRKCDKWLTVFLYLRLFDWTNYTCIITNGWRSSCIITRVQLDTRIKYARPIGRVYLDTRPNWTRVIIHVSIWTRVFNTRVQLDTCIKYACQFVAAVQLDTCLIRHVSNWMRVYSNRYCRHASNCQYFCSDTEWLCYVMSWCFRNALIFIYCKYN